MKAAVYEQYGSPEVLHIKDIPKPTPKENELLIKVHATVVGFGDVMVRDFPKITPAKFTMPLPFYLPTRLMFGWNKPKIQILGAVFAGTVEAIGSEVTKFKQGDEVFGYLGTDMGANAEYVCIKQTGSVAIKPTNMSYEESTTIPYGAIMGIPALEKANLQPGQKVLINGASGGIGSIMMQYAKHLGAEVTGVCGTNRVDMVKAMGADHIIDYKKEDFTQNGERYDLIVDILGKSSFSACKNSLTPDGIYMLISFKTKHVIQMLMNPLRGGKKVICALSNESTDHIVLARELVEAGKLKSPVDRCYPLEQIADAHRYYESNNRRGNVVVTVTNSP